MSIMLYRSFSDFQYRKISNQNALITRQLFREVIFNKTESVNMFNCHLGKCLTLKKTMVEVILQTNL